MCSINMDLHFTGKILLFLCIVTTAFSALEDNKSSQGSKLKSVTKRYVGWSRHAWECHPGCKKFCLSSCKLSCCAPGAIQYTAENFPQLIQFQASIPKPKTVPRVCPAPCSTTCYPNCDQGCCSKSQPPAPFSKSVLPPPVAVVKPTRKNVCAVGCSPLCSPNCDPSCCYVRALIERRKQAESRRPHPAPKPKPHPQPAAKKPLNDGLVCSAECRTLCKPSCKFECCSSDYKPPPQPPRRAPPTPPIRPHPRPPSYYAPPLSAPAPIQYNAPSSFPSANQYFAPPPPPSQSQYFPAPMPADPYYGYAPPQPNPLPPPQPPKCSSPCSQKCAPFCTPQCCLRNAIHMSHYIVAPFTNKIPELFHVTPKPHVVRGPSQPQFVKAAPPTNPSAHKIVCSGICRDSCASICPAFCCDRSASVDWDKRTRIHKTRQN